MYIDFIKNDYSDKGQNEANSFVERDKKHLEKIIQGRIREDIVNIVERWYELDDIGFINDNEKFLELLIEAENLYSFGYYIGAISIIGIACEEFCKYLIDRNNIQDLIETQDKRLNVLRSNNILSKRTFKEFSDIRKLRNNCVHFNSGFKKLDETNLKSNASKIIKYFKSGLKSIGNLEQVHPNEVIDKLVSESNLSFDDFKLKQRNINKIKTGLDLQISPNVNYLCFTSNYYIAEIDIDTDFYKEMTLFDLDRNGVVIVDLTIPQTQMIRDAKLEVGNVILATLLSLVSTIGQTEEWHLLDIEDVFLGKYELK